MSQYVYNQLYCLLIFILSGIVISIAFDVFRIFRKSFKTSDLVTYIEDIIFWVLTGTFLLFIIFKFNNGEIRGYIFLGLAIGIIMYLLTLSKPFIIYSVKILLFIKNIVSVVFKIIHKILKKIVLNSVYIAVFNIKKVFLIPINRIKSAKKYKKA